MMVELHKKVSAPRPQKKNIRTSFRWRRSEILPLETYLNLNYLIHHTLDSYIHHCYLSDNGTRLECSRPLHAMFSLYFFHWNTHFMVSAHLRFISLLNCSIARGYNKKCIFYNTVFISRTDLLRWGPVNISQSHRHLHSLTFSKSMSNDCYIQYQFKMSK